MRTLIDDLLFLARSDADRNVKHFDLSKLIHKVYDTLFPFPKREI